MRFHIPEDPSWPAKMKQTAEHNARTYESCTQSILAAFMEEFGLDDPMVMRAAGAMHGGMMTSNTCGVVTAGVMVLGLVAGRERLEDGVDGLFPVSIPAQQLVKRLKARLGSTSCLELTGVDFSDLAQALRFMQDKENHKCLGFIASGAEEIATFLQEAARQDELPRQRVERCGCGCAAEVQA